MQDAKKSADEYSASDQLLNAVAEHMKMPFLVMRQHAELVRLGEDFNPEIIESAADSGLLLLENYLYWQTMSKQECALEMEQYSLSSMLYDIAHRLHKIAKMHDAQIELDIRGKFGAVMTHPQTLESALVSLGLSFVESTQDASPIVLGVHKNRWGIVAGVYSRSNAVSSDVIKSSKRLSGAARQPMPTVSHSSMSGYIIADALLELLETPLKLSKHRRLSGLAATLSPNSQLALL